MFMLDADDGKSLVLLMLIMSHHLMRMLNVGYNNIGLTVISLLLVLMLIPVVMLMLNPTAWFGKACSLSVCPNQCGAGADWGVCRWQKNQNQLGSVPVTRSSSSSSEKHITHSPVVIST